MYSKLLIVLNKVERQKSMEKALDILRSYHFVFFNQASFERNFGKALGQWMEEKHKKYSFMVREIEPMTLENPGKFDTSIILAIKLDGKKNRNIHVYEHGKFTRTFELPWEDSQGILWRKVKITVKFPDKMTYDERKIWRRENERVKKNPDIVPSEFYLKWKPLIKNLD